MRRISSHIPLIAVLVALCLMGQTIALSAAPAIAAEASTSLNKAALNKAVQEALAKAKTGTGTEAQGALGGAGAQGGLGGGEAGSLGGGVGGSSESFSNLTSKAEAEEPGTKTTETTAPSTSTSSISLGVLVPIFIVGGLLLGGIAFFIVRDARSIAPAGDGLGSVESAQDRAARLRKRRAKAKAARRQRKRNR